MDIYKNIIVFLIWNIDIKFFLFEIHICIILFFLLIFAQILIP